MQVYTNFVGLNLTCSLRAIELLNKDILLTRQSFLSSHSNTDDCLHGYLSSWNAYGMRRQVDGFQHPKCAFAVDIQVTRSMTLVGIKNSWEFQDVSNDFLTVIPHHSHLKPDKHSVVQQFFLHRAHFESLGRLPSRQWCWWWTWMSCLPGTKVAFSLQSATAKSWHSTCT